MRLANSSRTLLPLALSAVLATCAFAQEHPNVNPNAVREQLAQPSSGAGGSQPQSAPQDSAPSAKEATAAAKASAKASKKAAAKSADKSAASAKADAKAPAAAKDATKSASAASGTPAAEKPAEEKPLVRRDPFDTLLTKARAGNAPPENLPPGKAGLIVDTLRIGGIVHSPMGMIAIVSNAQQRVYFLREGDKLYDGSVEKIDLDSIAFHEVGKDAFGKPLERTVTKRLNPSPGEQQ